MGTAHPSAETLSLYLEGWLTPAEVGGFEAHLAVCETCRNQVGESRRQREAHPGVGRPSPSSDRLHVAVAPLTGAVQGAPERLLPEAPSVPIVIPRQWGPLVALALVGVVALAVGVVWLLGEAEPAAVVSAEPQPPAPALGAAALAPDSGPLQPDSPPPPTVVEVALAAPVAETTPADAGQLLGDAGLPSADAGPVLAEPTRTLALLDAGPPADAGQVPPRHEASGLDAGGLADAGRSVHATPSLEPERAVDATRPTDAGLSSPARPQRTARVPDAGAPPVPSPRVTPRRAVAPPQTQPQPSNDPLDDWH
jgi:hypothetical protein